MARRPSGDAARLTRQLDALASWADDLSPAQRGTALPHGGTVGVLLDRLLADQQPPPPSACLDAETRLVVAVAGVAAALGVQAPLQRASVAAAVRATLADLAEAHPGQLVEVRVPPHGAVQIGRPSAATVHRRGTPPNVVETDPVTWLRLASGALLWEAARHHHAVAASGVHADLADVLPLPGLDQAPRAR